MTSYAKLRLLPNEPPGQCKCQPRGSLAIRTTKEVAAILGVTRQDVERIERLAFWKLRKALDQWR